MQDAAINTKTGINCEQEVVYNIGIDLEPNDGRVASPLQVQSCCNDTLQPRPQGR
jgi:hypothetical protein